MDIPVVRQSLRQKLETIVGERSPASGQCHLAAVEAFIESEFQRYGLKVERDVFVYRGRHFHNIIGSLNASPKGPSVILGAHFDAVENTPGADDNASGVAVLLETARILAQAKLRMPLHCCAFNLEEWNMIGSTHFARKLKAAGAKLAAMISLEMVGYIDARQGRQKYPFGLGWLYPDRGDFIGVIGNWNSATLLQRFARQMRQVRGLPVETLSVPGTGGLLPAVRLSDHAPFWDAGYPALMVTDTAFFRNPHYHRRTDTLATLNLDFIAKVCEGVVRGVLGL